MKIGVLFDVSKKGLGRCSNISKKTNNGNQCHSHRVFTDFEAKLPFNEIAFLAVVLAIEHFKNYVYGVEFHVIFDHKALASVFKPNTGNKPISSRITRCVDRLLPFELEITHEAEEAPHQAEF